MRKVNQVVSATITALFLCGVPAAQAWTTEDTEEYWADKAARATRITTAPRSIRADAEIGEEMLAAFGTKYLPQAYALYRAKREKAKEKEAVLKENFPDGRRPSSTGREFYDKVAKVVAKAVAEMDRRHDELCYYYLLHRIGAVADAELKKIDSSPIAIMLFQDGELKGIAPYKKVKEEEWAFAEKYLPTVLADYDFLSKVFIEIKAVYADGVKMDAGNAGLVLLPIAKRLDEIRQRIDMLAETMRQQKTYYALEETTAEKLAELDRKMAREIQRFKAWPPLRHYVKSWLKEKWTEREWRLFVPLSTRNLARTMVRIPGRDYAICKYEVTQSLWAEVMRGNPSHFKGANLPVERVSWEECQRFLFELNNLPEVRKKGLIYRLPTENEWKYACRAGTSGDFCKLLDGTEITAHSLESVAWLAGNSGEKSHPIGQKEPNAFGLYDMYGNVWEWCQDLNQAGSPDRVCCGGSWFTRGYAPSLQSGRRRRSAPETEPRPNFCTARRADGRGYVLGFRLAASLEGAKPRTDGARFVVTARLLFNPRKISKIETLTEQQLLSILDRSSLKRKIAERVEMPVGERESLPKDVEIAQERNPPNMFTLTVASQTENVAVQKANAYADILIEEYVAYRTTDLENRRTSVASRRKTLLDQLAAIEAKQKALKTKAGGVLLQETLLKLNSLISDQRRNLSALGVDIANENVKRARLEKSAGELAECETRLAVLGEKRCALEQEMADNEKKAAELTAMIPEYERLAAHHADMARSVRALDEELSDIAYSESILRNDLRQIERASAR